jgi:hypothetical protein
VFSTTELYQLLKIPLLIQHFIEHREENKNITLTQFLYIHYGTGDVKDSDYDKDMKLPFKTHDNCVTAISNVYLPSAKVSIQKPIQFLPKKSFIKKDHSLLTSHLSNIWQPPKFC